MSLTHSSRPQTFASNSNSLLTSLVQQECGGVGFLEAFGSGEANHGRESIATSSSLRACPFCHRLVFPPGYCRKLELLPCPARQLLTVGRPARSRLVGVGHRWAPLVRVVFLRQLVAGVLRLALAVLFADHRQTAGLAGLVAPQFRRRFQRQGPTGFAECCLRLVVDSANLPNFGSVGSRQLGLVCFRLRYQFRFDHFARQLGLAETSHLNFVATNLP